MKIDLSVAGYFAAQQPKPTKRKIPMSDIIDQANEVAQQNIERALASAPKFDRPSLTECSDCGEFIPIERQRIGGVTRCIDCQNYHDKKTRGYKR